MTEFPMADFVMCVCVVLVGGWYILSHWNDVFPK